MLIGNLTRDPELRYTPSGTAVCSFRVATNRSWTPSDGSERKEETEFHRIVAWNKLAELCSQLLVKGRKVYVEGRLQTRSWETPEGDKKYITEVVSEDMVVLDSRRALEEREGQPAEEKEETKAEETKAEEPEAESVEKRAVEAKGEEAAPSKKATKQKGKAEGEETAEKAKEEADSGEIDVDDIPF
ncbi:MAG: hypothetical protein A2126_02180 [Candidatus Woykebacteria bacterium GWB1_45_5]|uniref:Single-stranded DNA-binding protein n=2 Tax=Candidatus Woykeibacteriota TaxID=1817899 RepID=A0A1G1W3B8_9BACT|nr:MAG: hypothetical protein A2113_02600 [Candidatus Woykebacteria bacterium GWA1_44_8]OGY23938.1 MAG: hypothetical protein A2126_02180 [Candidatus Woykebacteria bacterium GWB1_45_5]